MTAGSPTLAGIRPLKSVDVRFEHALRVVLAAIANLKRSPGGEQALLELHDALQEAKLRYRDVGRRYGPSYGPGACKLLKAAKTAATLLPNARPASPTVRSIRRHVREVQQASQMFAKT